MALSALRRQLEFPGIPARSVLQTDRYMVRLCPDRVSTDVMEFETSLRLAESSVVDEEKIRLLSQAVELYQGELLSGFCHEWLLPERECLNEKYLSALERLIEHLAATGEHEEALGYARRTVDADPLRESAHGDLMRLLAAVGQVEEARRQYRRIKRLWKRELGHLPSASLRRLGREINRLSADPSRISLPLPVPPQRDRGGVAPAAGPPLPLPPSEPTPEMTLPSFINRFIGRKRELGRLTQRLTSEATRLVTLTGPGGSGKTRLAVQAARELMASYPGGVWFVPLAEVTNPDFIPNAILNTLEISEDPQRVILDQVAERLSQARSLLILDNFEHLVEGGAPLVGELLRRIPSTTCLITSRRRLGLTGEQKFPVPPLTTPHQRGGRGTSSEEVMGYESVQLFVDRAQLVHPDFAVMAENAEAVAELCHRLEGIPLAIELAAARAQILSPSQMLKKLQSALDLLVSHNRDVLPRHRSIRAVMDWSYALLPHEIRRFFAIQSVFQGTWSLEAAEAVSQEPFTLDYLAFLQEASLLVGQEEKGEVRFRMLEMLREYAGEHLSLQDRAGAERRHAEYYLHLSEEAEGHLHGPQRLRWIERLEAEADNLRSALSWSKREDLEAGLRLA
ncbi:MAG: AAA family ATPase, partial [Armatimonadetes bacterium]|nr:AAA family ATPase [Armatimonadota bacterium]